MLVTLTASSRSGSSGRSGRLPRASAARQAVRRLRRAASPARPPVLRKLALRRRPRAVPRFWRWLTPLPLTGPDDAGHGRLGMAGCCSTRATAAVASPAPADPAITQLVLDARHIPFIHTGSGRQQLYVPALYERRARAELCDYLRENRPLPPPRPVPVYRNAHFMVLSLLGLVVWHGVVMHWWPGTQSLPAQDMWVRRGSLDVYFTAHAGEWYRSMTALFLHAHTRHLFANVLFGAPFMVILGRRVGTGPALLLAVLAGALGNGLNALYRPPLHDSLGFSTALFGVVGVVTALRAVRQSGGQGRVLLPLAAGVGILASLGTGDGGGSGGSTDYGAHIFGLLAGLAVGTVAGALLHRWPAPSLWARGLCGLLAALLVVGSWWLAMAG